MKLIKLNCTACGAPISIPEDIEQLNCAVCGSMLYLERGEGYYSLKVAAKLADAIQSSSKSTEDAIRQTAEMTQRELRRMQLNQSLQNAETKMRAATAQQMAYNEQPLTPQRMPIFHNMIFDEWLHWEECRRLQMQLDVLDGLPIENNELALETQIDFINHSLLIMRQLPKTRENNNLFQSLLEEQNLYSEYLFNVKKNKKRSEMASFKISQPFSENLEKVQSQVMQLSSDIKRLHSLPPAPETGPLITELNVLNNQIYSHWRNLVHTQAWGEIDPKLDPGNDLVKINKYLTALHFELDHYTRLPNPPRELVSVIQSLIKQEKVLAQRQATLGEKGRFNEALKTLRKTLTGLAITQPFSMKITEVTGQLNTMQSELKSLDPSSLAPEVRQARQELHSNYSALYQHWTGLKLNDLKSNLTSNVVKAPFPQDMAEATRLYGLIVADIKTLDSTPDFPGLKALKQELQAKQRALYTHIINLQKAQKQ
ncbi:MAG: hypothetical protein MUO40_03200 [Anaerolineaceae bacterium]|nr:hypothetical protein [Anaerolineaceae bacterium]